MEVIDDATGITDIHFEDGDLVMATRTEAIGQHARQRTRTFFGEWFLDRQCGVQWLDRILGNRYNPGLAEAVIKTVAVNTAGVTGISSFSVSFDYRRREVESTSITLETVYDEEVTF